jgi:hypothetical protein
LNSNISAGRQFYIQWPTVESLYNDLTLAQMNGDAKKQTRTQLLIAVAEGQYDFTHFSLNRKFPEVGPLHFRDWFVHHWQSIP